MGIKLKLNPEPTFKAKVGIPVPGVGIAQVEFTFKHRTREEVVAWIEAGREQSDGDAVCDCVVAWGLDDEFTPENVARLCNNYSGAGGAIVAAYLDELRGARRGN